MSIHRADEIGKGQPRPFGFASGGQPPRVRRVLPWRSRAVPDCEKEALGFCRFRAEKIDCKKTVEKKNKFGGVGVCPHRLRVSQDSCDGKPSLLKVIFFSMSAW